MDYERDNLYTNMYLGTELRFDGLVAAVRGIVAKFGAGRAVKPATARA